jgi:sugar transferase (PEP-CTERM/EpsH1 system associated)
MKILVILSRVPYPLEKGDKLRAFYQIKSLSEKHEIILVALNDIPLHKDAKSVLESFCKKVIICNLPKVSILFNLIKAFFSGKPFQVGYFYNSAAQKQINEIIATENPDHVYCQLVRVAEYVRYRNIKKTIDYQDALSTGLERRRINVPFYQRFVFRMEALRMRNYEKEIFGFFNNKTIIAEQDRELIFHDEKEKIQIVRNGVDLDYYSPVDCTKNTDLIFTGNMNYPPNIDGAVFLATKVLPLLLEKYPDFKMKIAGVTPAPAVKELASEHVEVTGWVDDMRTCYAESKIFVAPMQLGSGLQNKLLEAMSMGIPCITSALANNSLQAEANKDILIGRTPEDYANHIFSLLENPEKAEQLAKNGFDFVHRNYSWDKHNSILENIICNT